jgi:hypothetical protein
LFKAIAVLSGALAGFGWGFELDNGWPGGEGSKIGLAIMASVAVALGALGYRWHKPKSALDFNVARRPGRRKFAPGRDRQWLPKTVWREFADPLPGVPDISGQPQFDVPDGKVPPDETLRRLWLVRAQLATFVEARTAQERAQVPGVWSTALTGIGMTTAVYMIISGVDADTGESLRLGGLFSGVFLAWPFGRSLLAITESTRLMSRRKKALVREEARLMALDEQRPGGPVGGEAFPKNSLAARRLRLVPYVPPEVPADGLS